MTHEHRLVVGLSDIKAVVLVCASCGVRVSLAPDSIDPIQFQECPACHQQWYTLPPVGRPVEKSAVPRLLDGLKGAIADQAHNPKVLVLFEYEITPS